MQLQGSTGNDHRIVAAADGLALAQRVYTTVGFGHNTDEEVAAEADSKILAVPHTAETTQVEAAVLHSKQQRMA